MPHNAMRNTPPYNCLQVPAEREQPCSTSSQYWRWRQHVTPPCVLMPLPRSDQSSLPAHWPGPCQYQTHHLQRIPYTSIWCTLWAHHLAARLPWHSTPQGKIVLVHCRHPGPTILGLPSSEKLAVVKNCAIMVR